MLCVTTDAGGAVVLVDPQPVDLTTCASVLVSGSDAINSPFALTPEQGSEIGGAILGVWAVAYVFRVIIRAFSIGDESKED